VQTFMGCAGKEGVKMPVESSITEIFSYFSRYIFRNFRDKANNNNVIALVIR